MAKSKGGEWKRKGGRPPSGGRPPKPGMSPYLIRKEFGPREAGRPKLPEPSLVFTLAIPPADTSFLPQFHHSRNSAIRRILHLLHTTHLECINHLRNPPVDDRTRSLEEKARAAAARVELLASGPVATASIRKRVRVLGSTHSKGQPLARPRGRR